MNVRLHSILQRNILIFSVDDPTVNPNILENLSDGSSDGPSPRRPRPRRPGPRRSSPTRQELKEEVHRLIILAEDMVKDDSMDKKLKALRQEVRQLRKTVAQLKGEPTRIVVSTLFRPSIRMRIC